MSLCKNPALTPQPTTRLLSYCFLISAFAFGVFAFGSLSISAKEVDANQAGGLAKHATQSKATKDASKTANNDKATTKAADKKKVATKSAEHQSSTKTSDKAKLKSGPAKTDVQKTNVQKASNQKANNQKASGQKPNPLKQNIQKPNIKVEQSKAELNNIHQRIETLQKDLANKQEAQADVSDALKESEKSISDTNRKLFELNQKHQQNRSTLSALQQQKADLQSTITEQKALLASQYYQQYIHGKPNYIQAVLQAQQPGAMARQVQYLSYISRARSQLIASMNDNLDTVIKLNTQTAETLKQITSLKTEQEKQRLALVSEKNEHSQVLAKLSSQISAQRNEIDKLKRDEANLSQLVETLTRKLAEQAARQKLARSQPKPNKEKSNQGKEPNTLDNNNAETPPPQRSTTIARNETLPSEAFEGGNFNALRGRLNLPVRGELTNRFGDARADTGVSWKGLFIRANEGSEVKSIASGRVVFADWMRGFGNLLIIDHGDGYMSLYGNNQALLRKVGDTVKGGDTVASVGNSGGNETNGLYYELRKQSKPFDPLSWSVVR